MPLKYIILGIFVIGLIGAFMLFPKMVNQLHYSKYVLETPDTEPGENGYPLIIFLHGSGERGDDLSALDGFGPSVFLAKNPNYSFAYLAPLCAEGKDWNNPALLRLIDEVESKIPVDTDRIYLTGLSMGGYGTWHLAQHAPKKFAAIAPICGGSNYGLDFIDRIKHLPVWAFHGAQDEIISYQESEKLINRLKEIGGNAKFTLYPELNHNSWDTTYSNPKLYDWFLSQEKQVD